MEKIKKQITNRFTGAVIFEADCETLRKLVEAALKSRADLSEANLSGVAHPVFAQIEKRKIRAEIAEIVTRDMACLKQEEWHHKCGSAHCGGGWCVTLHPAGKILESLMGTNAAAALIFHVCEGEVPNFSWDEITMLRWLNGESAAQIGETATFL